MKTIGLFEEKKNFLFQQIFVVVLFPISIARNFELRNFFILDLSPILYGTSSMSYGTRFYDS